MRGTVRVNNPAGGLDISPSQRRVLEVIRRCGPISRAELVPLTNLTAGAISRHCRDLLSIGMITEQTRRSGLRGQPAVPLVVNGGCGVSIGMAIALNRLEMVAVDYTGAILATVHEMIAREDMPCLLAALDKASDRLGAALGAAPWRLVGLGLALSGIASGPAPPFVHLAPTMEWTDPGAVLAWGAERWGKTLMFANNANTAALAEMHAARDPALRNLIGLNLGHGVGAGIMLNRRIHEGVGGVAGEIGRLFPRNQPRPSGRDLLMVLRSIGRDVPDVAALGAIDPDSDPIVAAWIERVVQQLSPIVSLAWLLLVPQEIVLTSIPPSLGTRIAAGLAAGIDPGNSNLAIRPPVVRAARLGTLSSAVGAAWLPIEAESGLVQTDFI